MVHGVNRPLKHFNVSSTNRGQVRVKSKTILRAGLVFHESEEDFKYGNVARSGFLICFIRTPHAKFMRIQMSY